MAHTEWLLSVQLRHLVPPMHYIWQSTSSSSQTLWVWFLVTAGFISFPSKHLYIYSNMRQEVLWSMNGCTHDGNSNRFMLPTLLILLAICCLYWKEGSLLQTCENWRPLWWLNVTVDNESVKNHSHTLLRVHNYGSGGKMDYNFLLPLIGFSKQFHPWNNVWSN